MTPTWLPERVIRSMMRLECFGKDATTWMCGVLARCMQSLGAPLFLLSACASTPGPSARDVADANDTGATVDAKSASDRALLRELSALPSGTPRRIGDATVIAQAPYAAASGRSCRALHVTLTHPETVTHRLACSDGKTWFFVPNVFGGDAAGE